MNNFQNLQKELHRNSKEIVEPVPTLDQPQSSSSSSSSSTSTNTTQKTTIDDNQNENESVETLLSELPQPFECIQCGTVDPPEKAIQLDCKHPLCCKQLFYFLKKEQF